MDNSPFTIREAWISVRDRYVLVIVIAFAILTIVGLATVFATKYYESQAKIFVRLGRENVGLDPTTTLGEGTIITTPTSRESEINSVVHLIRSRDLYTQVVDHFGSETILRGKLESDSESKPSSVGSMLGAIKNSMVSFGILNDISLREKAIIALSKKVSVKALDRSNVISVSFETKDPALAQDVVAFLIERYKQQHGKVHRSEGAEEFMQRQASGFLKTLNRKEKALEDFKIESGMVSAELQKQERISRIANIFGQLRSAQVEAEALETEVTELKSKFQDVSPSVVVAETRGAGNEAVDGMRKLLYEQEITLAELLGKHTEAHPEVMRMQRAVDSSKSVLGVVESQRTESVKGSNPVYAEIQIELIKKEPLLMAARQRVAQLEKQVELEREELKEFTRNEIKFIQLTRDFELEDENYRRYVRGLAQISVDESLEENMLSNISISQPATYSEKPSRPNKLLNLIIGIFLASLGSFGTAILLGFMNRTVETREQIEEAFDLPVIATVPRMASRPRDITVEV